MNRSTRLLPAVILGLASVGAVRASSPVVWEYPSPADLGERGGLGPGEHIDGVALRHDGGLLLSAPVREVFPRDAFEPPVVIWVVDLDAEGNLYLGTGNDGKVYQVDRKGTATLLFDFDQLGVRGVATGREGNYFVSTFPAGGVYHVVKGESAQLWLGTEDRYVWSIVIDPSDRVYAATGEKGILYLVEDPEDESVLFDSDESHITTLFRSSQGEIFAGTSPDALLYRIVPGRAPVILLDSDLTEISAISTGPDGVVYAGAIGERRIEPGRRPGRRNDLTIEVSPASDSTLLEEQAAPSQKIRIDLADLLPARQDEAEDSAGRIYRVSTDGEVTIAWSSNAERVYALAHTQNHGVVFGTGGPAGGRVYRLEPDGSATLLHQLAEQQATGLKEHEDGRIYIATANPGRVHIMDNGRTSRGEYRAAVRDAGRMARWGTLSWEAETPPGTRVEVSTRSGHRPTPDGTWSDWSPPAPGQRGSPVISPPARYLQWRVELSRLEPGVMPQLLRVTVTSLPQNRRPELGGLSILAPGSPLPADRKNGNESKPEEPPDGRRWVRWAATDPDGDDLSRSLWLRREGAGGEYRRVASRIAEDHFALDDTSLDEGRYRIRLDVDDSPTNGSERARASTLTSATFLVDHTPPRLTLTRTSRAEGRLRVEAAADDAPGTISRAEYRVDEEDDDGWTTLPCRDGICDTSEESLLLEMEAPGRDRAVTIRVYDAAGNVATLEVPSNS